MMPQSFSQLMIMEVLFLITLVLYPAIAASSTLDASANIYCAPYSAIVPVDPKSHSFFPFFVRLFRCQGSVGLNRPSLKKCVVNKYTLVNVSVASMSSIAGDGDTVKSLKNHTSCQHECVKGPKDCHPQFEYLNGNDCVCKCKYRHKAYKSCKQGYKWNSNACRCQCDRPPSTCTAKQIWSKEHCGCVILTRSVKSAGENEDYKSKVYISFLILEAVAIVILICILVHWVRKKKAPEESVNADTPREDYTMPLRDGSSNTRLSYGAD